MRSISASFVATSNLPQVSNDMPFPVQNSFVASAPRGTASLSGIPVHSKSRRGSRRCCGPSDAAQAPALFQKHDAGAAHPFLQRHSGREADDPASDDAIVVQAATPPARFCRYWANIMHQTSRWKAGETAVVSLLGCRSGSAHARQHGAPEDVDEFELIAPDIVEVDLVEACRDILFDQARCRPGSEEMRT